MQTKMDISEKSDAILDYLMGDWTVEGLEGIIQTNFSDYDTHKVEIVAQNVADFCCSNNNQNGYTMEEFEEILLGKEFEIDESLF